jgi:hypothetical protein
MPRLTRWYLRSALGYLTLTLLLGLWLAAGSVFDLPFGPGRLHDLYLQLFMLGWISQLIFGIANWMFPTFSRAAPRRNPSLGWLTFILLNAGLLLRMIMELVSVVTGVPASALLRGFALSLQWLAALLFVVNTWGRVK